MIRNDIANAAAWVFYIILKTRDNVPMQMANGSSCRFAIIDSMVIGIRGSVDSRVTDCLLTKYNGIISDMRLNEILIDCA